MGDKVDLSGVIPLLSQRALDQFTPEEFKSYVRSLYKAQKKKEKAIKIKTPFKWSITKTGKISIKVTRKPKWITRETVVRISAESGIEERLIWVYCAKKKITIVATQEEGEKLTQAQREIS